jgi:pimeloyl-ACP methyl ester carboxylesterase
MLRALLVVAFALAVEPSAPMAQSSQATGLEWRTIERSGAEPLKYASISSVGAGRRGGALFVVAPGSSEAVAREVEAVAKAAGSEWVVAGSAEPLESFAAVSDAVLARPDVGAVRLHVVGAGDGGRDALRLALRHAERMASVVAIAPAALEERELEALGGLAALPIALIHGREDPREPVLAVLERSISAGGESLAVDFVSTVEHASAGQCEGRFGERLRRFRAAEDARAAAESAVRGLLDEFHLAASKADGGRYFACLAPDAIFVGTDATERWDVARFREFCEPYFREGRGWTYVASERHVALSADRKLGWFDEQLANEKYGQVRGSGVVRFDGGRWRIVQYVMSFPIPNDLSGEVTRLIRGLGR